VLTLSKENAAVIAGPDIITRGFVYSRESEDLIKEATNRMKEELKKHEENNVTEWSVLKATIKDTAGKYLYEMTQRNPIILPIIMEI
jgi:ribonuclease J